MPSGEQEVWILHTLSTHVHTRADCARCEIEKVFPCNCNNYPHGGRASAVCGHTRALVQCPYRIPTCACERDFTCAELSLLLMLVHLIPSPRGAQSSGTVLQWIFLPLGLSELLLLLLSPLLGEICLRECIRKCSFPLSSSCAPTPGKGLECDISIKFIFSSYLNRPKCGRFVSHFGVGIYWISMIFFSSPTGGASSFLSPALICLEDMNKFRAYRILSADGRSRVTIACGWVWAWKTNLFFPFYALDGYWYWIFLLSFIESTIFSVIEIFCSSLSFSVVWSAHQTLPRRTAGVCVCEYECLRHMLRYEVKITTKKHLFSIPRSVQTRRSGRFLFMKFILCDKNTPRQVFCEAFHFTPPHEGSFFWHLPPSSVAVGIIDHSLFILGCYFFLHSNYFGSVEMDRPFVGYQHGAIVLQYSFEKT